MQKIQPEIQKVQQQHKNNKEEQAKALMAVYRENKINPFSSIIYIALQLPILIAVYQIFFKGLTTESFTGLYDFVSAPAVINPDFLGLINITEPSMIIVSLAVLAQFWQAKTSMAKQPAGGKVAPMTKYMVYIGPLLTLLILPKLSAAIGLYWITTSVFSVFQQHLINKQLYKPNSSS